MSGRGRTPHRPWPVLEVALLLAGLVFVSPCMLALLNAFKTNTEIIMDPLAMPRSPGWDNFAFIFQGMKLARPMVNSLLMCVAVIGSLVTIGPMAAWSIVRRRMATGRLLRVEVSRKVARDCTIGVRGRRYELPADLVGRHVAPDEERTLAHLPTNGRA